MIEPGLEPTLPANVFVILRDLIHERIGMYYDDEKRALLADKLAPLVGERGFHSFLDYYYLLKYGPGDDQEWPLVIDALSVQETYFWREMGQIKWFVKTLVPQFAAAKPGHSLDIWCAACATGEEPLTIAMLLAEAGWFDRLAIRIFATDASRAALVKAQKGLYRDRSFRALPPLLADKYFIETSTGRQVVPELHERVSWARANLLNAEDIASYAVCPFIFCRNVFIYFSDQTISRTISRFAGAMPRPGYLFVGASESLLKLTDDFDLREAGDAFVYVADQPHREGR